MDYSVRPARMDDHAAIASFTKDTFSWGDYVTRVYKDWIADRDGLVLVAADGNDRAIGMAKVTMLAPEEGWAQGARVHPDWRRRGVGTALSDELWTWAAERGAKVVRLLVDDWNETARAQVAAMGFRPVSRWVFAHRAVGDAGPVPEGNGGRRTPAPERLKPVPSSEVEPAYLSWASGPLSHAARQLFPVRWQWRRLTIDDLVAAARRNALWEGPPGWAVGEFTKQVFDVGWLETTAENAHLMARALVDAAADVGAEGLEVKVPTVDWMVRALRRINCELHPQTVYARSM